MKTWYTRYISLLLLICMTVSLLPAEAMSASIGTVNSSGSAQGVPEPHINWHDVSLAPSSLSSEIKPSFQDVKAADWYYPAVQYVQQHGIFSGTGNGNFTPQGTMTRAMYITVLGRIAGVDISGYTAPVFEDVPPDSWYGPYVAWAVEKEITTGTGGGRFSPEGIVSREQIAVLTLRYFETVNVHYEKNGRIETKPKDIAAISPWAVDAVIKLWQAGVLKGDTQGRFNPKAKATRAEAAVLSMTSHEVILAFKEQEEAAAPPAVPEAPAIPAAPSPIVESPGNPGGGSPSASTYIISFETNGGTAIQSLSYAAGAPVSQLPVPVKAGAIFQGWFKDAALTQLLRDGEPVTGSMMLYAKYIDSVHEAVQSIPSVTVLDQSPRFTLGIQEATGSLTAEQVRAGMTFEAPANPGFAGIQVTGSQGTFTAAAQEGAFEEGNTYQVTLTDDKLSFTGQDPSTRVYVFSISKQEVAQLPLNPKLIYVPASEVQGMSREGTPMSLHSVPVMRASVTNGGAALSAADVTNGTFNYAGSMSIDVGDTVSIYEGTRPDQRTVNTTEADNGEVAYVEITAKNGTTYTYTSADAEEVLLKPDVLPVSSASDIDGDPDNNSITVDHAALNFQDSKYAPLGLSELTTVQEGDYIAFYEGEFGSQSSSAGYARITSVTSAGSEDIITYTEVTSEDIASALDFYQKQRIDGDELLEDAQEERLEAQIKQQAIESGFVQEAADYLSTMALQTDGFKQRYDERSIAASKGSDIEVSVENLTVVPSIGTKLKHFPGHTGASVTLQVQCDIIIDTDEGNDDSFIIHMTSTFEEEIRFELGINGDTQVKWYWFIPIIQDYTITANLDAYTYTGINITAEMGTIEKDKGPDWSQASDITNIAQQMQALMDGVQMKETLNASTLKQMYQELLQNETEWVPLLSQELLQQKKRICYGVIEIEFTVNFVISLNPNITLGSDFGYKSAKRYSVTVRVLSRTGASNTVSLSGDGEYHIKLYVLGTLGLRAGIQMQLKAGLFSVDLNSVGFEVEAGPYLKLMGYFYYQLVYTAAAGTQTQSAGAMYMEIGIYLESIFAAQLGNGALSAQVPLYSNEWPLYSAGSQLSVDDFVYVQEDTPVIQMVKRLESESLPSRLFTMSAMDLKSGEVIEKVYDASQFTIEMTNPEFKYDAAKNVITVTTNKGATHGEMVLTWKQAPLAFTSAPIKRVVELSWINNDYTKFLQFYPGNGDSSLLLRGQYNEKIVPPAPPVRAGYTFKGWYTEDGKEFIVPDRMPENPEWLYAKWEPRTDTPYKVEHYLIDPNTNEASLAATENLKGTSGTELRISSNKYQSEGYLSGYVGGVYIKGDGSTVAKIYYERHYATLTFSLGYRDSRGNELFTRSITARNGKNISTQIPGAFRAGYTFTGWSSAVPAVMPTKDMTFTATWRENEDTPYKVVHLLQDLPILSANAAGQVSYTDALTYSVAESNSFKGTTNAAIQAAPKSFDGFTYDSSAPNTLTASTINGDGSSVLRLYYKRNRYQVTFDGNGGALSSYPSMIPHGASIRTPSAYRQYAQFEGWSPEIPAVMPMRDMTFQAVWTFADGLYLAYHSKETLQGGAYEPLDNPEKLYAQAGSTVTAAPKEYVGFTYDTSVPESVSSGTVNLDSTNPLRLKLYYKRNSYNLTFDANGGTGGSVIPVKYGASILASDIPRPVVTREGYLFRGWIHPDPPAIMPAQDVTFIADWSLAAQVATADINNTAPAIGDTLAVTVRMSDSSSPDGQVIYQWQVETAVGSGVYQNAVGSGSTAASYTVTAAESHKRLRVVVTGVGQAVGEQISAATEPVLVLVTGVTTDHVQPAAGEAVTALVTMNDGQPAGGRISYQWQVETTAGSGSYTAAAGTGNESPVYTAAADDVGKKLRVVVSGVSPVAGSHTSTATRAVAAKVSRVTIDNTTPSLGDILTADVVMSDSSIAGSQVSYQWEVETTAGSSIYQQAHGAGSNTASYTVAAADSGKRLQVTVRGVDPAIGTETAVTSAVTVRVLGAVIQPSDPWVGTTIHADVTMADGLPAGSRAAYQWQVETAPGSGVYQDASGQGSSTSAYMVAAADGGKRLQVVVTGIHPGVGTVISAATNAATTSPADEFISNAKAAGLTSITKLSSTETVVASDHSLSASLRVPAGITMNVNGNLRVLAGTTLAIDGTVHVYGNLGELRNSGTVLVESSGTVVINSGVSNSGTWTNNGTIQIPAGQGGTMRSEYSSTLNGSGRMDVSGRLEFDFANVNLTGPVEFTSSALHVVNGFSVISKDPSYLTLSTGAGVTLTYVNGVAEYTLNGNATVMVNFSIKPDQKYLIASTSALRIVSGRTLTIDAGALMVNQGTLTNDGTITNHGTLNSTQGTIVNNGSINGNTPET
ncbi:cell wall/surface repeat protein [Paenibacillus algicola]|uniref:Cell wall/surface repeat protein n=1 Tax=Paenibacillus algicola TaxID=2565926 RepID=A0A4P8XPP3_9BACL|nr:InlB B-repeat-containing protein [Paenibacillus algicola]QCT04836.1 cell wall/surface repeat protein [Paenibacillus algicola]